MGRRPSTVCAAGPALSPQGRGLSRGSRTMAPMHAARPTRPLPTAPTLPARHGAAAWRRLVLLASFTLGSFAATADTDQRVQVLHQATAVNGPAAAYPVGRVAATVSLPAQGAATGVDDSGSVWLRLRFDRPGQAPAADLWAVQVPYSCGWIDVDLNGQAVHRDPSGNDGDTSSCPRARLFPLPAALLRDRDNQLDLRLRARPAPEVTSVRRAPLLSAVSVGPHQLLAEAQGAAEFWQTMAVRIADVKLALLGAFMLLLAAANRRGPHLAWFGATALLWAAALAPAWWNAVPLPSAALELLLASLMAPATATALLFLAAFLGRTLPRLGVQCLVAQCLLLPVSLGLLPADARADMAAAWRGLLGLEIAAGLVLFIHACRGDRRRDATTLLAILGLGALVWLVEAATMPEGLTGGTAWAWVTASPFGVAVVLSAVGGWLLYLFNQALVSAEATRQSLETRVREITAEIEHNFAQLSEMRVEQMTQQERKRIAADLHDDLGAKLLTIVHTCNNERIAALGREALDDMRLSVRGLNGKPMRLVDAMADWRAETVQRLGQTNIQVEWQSPHEEIDHLLPARAFVQTTRILREAVSNIIKHSGASRCLVVGFASDGEYGLVIEDNGRGIPIDFDTGRDRGHGLASMKNRAKQLRGQCLVESGAGLGTVIRLTLPLEARGAVRMTAAPESP